MNKKLNINRLIFEFISVSFAVLFALLLNQWREDYNHEKLADKTIINIKKELSENSEILDTYIPKHKTTLREIDSLIAIAYKDENTSNKNIDLTIMNSSAWEMAKITNAVFYMNFDLVNNLSKVYKLQAYYESIVKQYILKDSDIYHSETDINYLMDTKQFLETVIPLEENLEGYYKLMIEEVLTKK